MQFHFKLTLLIVTAFLPVLLTGCGGLNVEKIPLEAVSYPPEDAQPSPVGFNKIRFAVPTGAPTVASAPGNFLEWLLTCEGPYGLTSQGSIRGRSMPSDSWREIFFTTLEGQGYDVAGNPGRLFDEEADLQRAVYSVGGRITDLKINTCEQSSWFGRIPRGSSGEGHVEVEWTVYDLLNRRNVYLTTTKGYGRTRTPNHEGPLLLFEEALAASIHNLGADEQFHNLVFFGTAPQEQPDTYTDPYEDPISRFEPHEDVVIARRPLSQSPAAGRLEDIARAAVLIQAGSAHGSGYFITQQGHMLTNAHVVGHALRVRVVTSGKKEKLVAEVLRVDRKRDVALLRLEEIPDDLKIKTLPVRLDKPDVGEEVYAIGSPSLTRLQDTVTKGIISAHRYNRQRNQPEIQADVYTFGGNSGGPLLDINGNIIGMSFAGYARGEQDLSGLNLFIPIGDALEKLDISLDGAAPPARTETPETDNTPAENAPVKLTR